ncbi:MAG TPA: hypothetical protein VGI77_10130 [Gaiellaceae bacterium]
MTRLRIERGSLPSLERLALLGYLLLQELVVLGLKTPRFPDSKTYMHLDLTGGALRLPTVPLLYKIFPSDDSRIAAQVVLAAAAWWIVARVASTLIGDRRVGLALRGVLLLLGLVGAVASWNSIVLSESATISLTVLAIAAWMRFAVKPTSGRAAVAVAVTLVWTLARQPNVLFGLALTVAVLIALAASRIDTRLRVAMAVALVCVNVIGLVEVSRNQTLSKNALEEVLQIRILPNADWTSWFVSHGMPYSPAVARYAGVPAEEGEPLPEFVQWLHTKGEHAYVQFILEHPKYLLLDPLPYFTGEGASLHHPSSTPFGALQPNPTPSMLSPSVNYGRSRSVMPSVVESLLWDSRGWGDVLTLAALAFGAAILAVSRHGVDRRFVVPGIVAVLVVPEGYILWLSGGEATGELDRLSMVTAVSVRVALWTILAIAVDRLVAARTTRQVSA